MKLYRSLLFLTLTGSLAAVAQPTINNGGIVNAASYALAGLPNSSIAQGSMFIAFGKDWAAVTAAPQSAPSFPLPTTAGLDGVTANVMDSGGANRPVILIWVWNSGSTTASWSSALAGILPSTVATGTANLTITYNGQTSAPMSFNVVPSSVGIFSVNQQGTGPGVITDNNHTKTAADQYKVLSQTNPGTTGDNLTIWSTGVGPVTFDETKPPPSAVNLQGKVNATVYFGNVAVTGSNVTYAGRSGNYPGLDQINVVVPAGVSGCYVPVMVVINNIASNTVTTAINTGGTTCTDTTFGFSSQDLQTLLSKGSLKIGVLDLGHSSTSLLGQMFNSDFASASFNQFTATTLGSSTSPFGFASLNGCIVTQFSGNNQPVNPFVGTGLDAGPQITVTPPAGGAAVTLTDTQTKGEYIPSSTLPGGFLSASGNYTFANGSGGADVGGFSEPVPWNAGFTWTNSSGIATAGVTRSAGQMVTWTGSDPNGFVEISGFSTNGDVGAFYVCIVPGSQTSFTVPAPVLDTLPASGTSGSGFMSVGSTGKPISFTVTGLDKAYAITSDSSSVTVAYQ